MAEKITYYAIIDEFSSREQPVGTCSAASRTTKARATKCSRET